VLRFTTGTQPFSLAMAPLANGKLYLLVYTRGDATVRSIDISNLATATVAGAPALTPAGITKFGDLPTGAPGGWSLAAFKKADKAVGTGILLANNDGKLVLFDAATMTQKSLIDLGTSLGTDKPFMIAADPTNGNGAVTVGSWAGALTGKSHFASVDVTSGVVTVEPMESDLLAAGMGTTNGKLFIGMWGTVQQPTAQVAPHAVSASNTEVVRATNAFIPPTIPAPVTISVTPANITAGQSATIKWSALMSGCTASGDWIGEELPTNGSQPMTPPTAGTYNFVLTCGNAAQTATLTVSGPSSHN
jgi:hypothetical protein